MIAGRANSVFNTHLSELVSDILRENHLSASQQERLARAMAAGTDDLARQLIVVNFNHVRVLQWWQQHVYTRCAGGASLSDRLPQVIGLREEISLIAVTDCAPCFPRSERLKPFVLATLDELFRNAVLSHLLTPPPVRPVKIAVTLSVAELGLLLKLLKEQDVFRSENVREVLRCAVSGLSSKRQGDVSFRNLSKEYYGATQCTAASVRSLLRKMLDALNARYFPLIVAIGALTGNS